jgi:SAM-dependent methyltransferase
MPTLRTLGERLRQLRGTRADDRMTAPELSAPDEGGHEALLAPDVRVFRDGAVLVHREWSPVNVTSQFIEDAETYHQRYFDRLDFDALIGHALALAGVDREPPLRVLDVGSGGGSSVLAACRLLPRAEIVASDISPQLLEMLARFVESRAELRGRVRAFCFDLHRPFFRAETFDLVVGAAILHHLLDPRAALANVAESLKAGGRMIFVEPLESGSLVMAVVYARVLEVLARSGRAEPDLEGLMKALRLDTQSRLGPPAEKPWTAQLDDKWIFDEPYLFDLARALGMSKVDIHPAQDDLSAIYETGFRSVLADSGNAGLAIPEAVLDAVREFDRAVGADLKRRLCPTGIIVFTK